MAIDLLEKFDLTAALEMLMLRHGHQWLRFVQGMVQNRADAEDVLQEAALKMLVRARQFRSLDQARMYLGRIICNTAIELYHFRRRYRRRHGPLHDRLAQATDVKEAIPLPWEDWAATEATICSLLNEGLANLPVAQAEALRMTVMAPASVSIRDAGAAHGIPYSTLRHRKLKGLMRLRRFLHRSLRPQLR